MTHPTTQKEMMANLRRVAKAYGLRMRTRQTRDFRRPEEEAEGHYLFPTFGNKVIVLSGIDRLSDEAWAEVHDATQPLSLGGCCHC